MRRLPPVHTAKRLQTGRGRHQPKWLVQDVGEEGGLERFPITWNHVIEKESLKFKELEHVLIEKVDQLFRDML